MLTAAEEFRLYGCLSKARTEELLDCELAMEVSYDAAGYIDEALGQWPEEDFLDDVIEGLKEQAKHRRGDKAVAMRASIALLEEIAQTVQQSAEHGQEQLGKALKLLRGG